MEETLHYAIITAKPNSYTLSEAGINRAHYLSYVRAYYENDATGRELAKLDFETAEAQALSRRDGRSDDLILAARKLKFIGDYQLELSSVAPGYYRVIDFVSAGRAHELIQDGVTYLEEKPEEAARRAIEIFNDLTVENPGSTYDLERLIIVVYTEGNRPWTS